MKMKNPVVEIDTQNISDWDSFHSIFAGAFGFPDFYGRNMDAWIDCMTYLDEPDAGMTTIHVEKDQVLVLQILHAKEFAKRCPELYEALIECAAFVNWRRIEYADEPVMAISFFN